jgi:hypothetical protein
MIFLLLVVVLRPAGFTLYKWHFSHNFRLPGPCGGADLVDRVVNVLVNCLVVTPYMVQKDSVKELKKGLLDPVHWTGLDSVQTKWEYFWLFMFVILENIIALAIEVCQVLSAFYHTFLIRSPTAA